MIGKVLIFCAAVAFIADRAKGALLCRKEAFKISPEACSNYTYSFYADFARVYDCASATGESSVVEFEIWAGCSSIPETGSWSHPAIQTLSSISYASNQTAGEHCYCRIKSINGSINLPSSQKWVSPGGYVATSAVECSNYCAYSCAVPGQFSYEFRSALFNALE